MLQLFFQVLPLALAGAMSPTLFGLMTVILSKRERAIERGFAFLFGAMIPIVLLTLSIITILSQITLPVFHRERGPFSAAVDIVIGVALLVAGSAIWAERIPLRLPRRDRAIAETKQQSRANSSIIRTFWFGVGMMAINGTTLLMLIPAAKDIASSGLPFAQQIIIALIVDAIMLLSVMVPLVTYIFWPSKSAEFLENAEIWIIRNTRKLIVGICIVLGLFLIIRGIAL